MKDWIVKLDDFLKMSGRELLESKGIRSHTQAINKAKDEYEKFKQKTKDELSRIEKDFVKYIDKTGKALK
ncbi:RhuM family protein, partial [Aliarcobacter butzleri]